MDLPVFHLDVFNNRLLIALIAILHVVINHGMAVGGIPVVAWLEHRGLRDPNNAEHWDRLAYKLLTAFFIVTTTVGALTGVGIWLSAGLVNPYAIGSLIRVFFWAWFVEWIVFVTEVVLILIYFLTWKKWTGERKRRHARLGVGLAVASWITMTIIVAILGFMMDPGSWLSERTLLHGVFNPAYLPQLAFRTPLAMVMAGAFALVVVRWASANSPVRVLATATLSRWILAWTPFVLIGGTWYARIVPEAMKANVPSALLTQGLQQWASTAQWVLLAGVVLVLCIALWGALRPASLRVGASLAAAFILIGLLGTFERVREYVRKPYAIGGYLYANGFRAADYPLLQRDGVLAHATYTSVSTITDDNELEAGREVFTIACTRCHTVDGLTSIRSSIQAMYGDAPWNKDALSTYIGTMHTARPYMPPFPGSLRERDALAAWLVSLQNTRDVIEGAQTKGVTLRPPPLPAPAPLVSQR
jgi:mono/diheme cytochrome c family protein